MFIELCLLLVLLVITVKYLQFRAVCAKYKHLPGETQFPLPLYFPSFFKYILPFDSPDKLFYESVNELYPKYGSPFKTIFAGFPVVFFCDPDFNKFFSQQGSKLFVKNDVLLDFLTENFGVNVFTTANDQVWKRHRSLLNPAFTDHSLRCVTDATVQVMKQYIEEVERSTTKQRDILTESCYITLDVITRAGFGYTFDSVKCVNSSVAKDSFTHHISTILQSFIVYQVFPRIIREKVPFGIFNDVTKAVPKVRKDIMTVIENRKADPENEHKYSDILHMLLQSSSQQSAASEDEPSNTSEPPLTSEELFSNVFVFIVAGHDSTARALLWVLYQLAVHKDIQKKAQQFVDQVLQQRDPQHHDLENLSYIENIIKESMRYYPVIPIIPRVAKTDFEWKGNKIPKDTICLVDFAQNHRNKAYWGQDANEFKPERWEDPALLERLNTNKFVSTPFGIGNRSCIGRKFAMIELVVEVVMLLQKYNIDIDGGVAQYGPMELDVSISSRPRKRLYLNFERRQQ